MSTLLTAGFLIGVTKALSEALVAPLKKKWPSYDFWWWLYVAWVLGAVLTFLAGVNLFTEVVPALPALVGQILTAVVAGGGANLLHDAFDQKAKTSIIASSTTSGEMTATVTTSAPEKR